MSVIKKYLEENKISQREFARKLGADVTTIHRLCSPNKENNISLVLAFRIKEVTKSTIDLEDLVNTDYLNLLRNRGTE